MLLTVNYFVRMKGLEPPRHVTQDPKSCSATNYDTSALKNLRKNTLFYDENKQKLLAS